LDSLEVPFYFVWGNRDIFLFMDIIAEKGIHVKVKDFANDFVSSLNLKNVYHVSDRVKVFCDPELYVSSNKGLVDRRTIFVTHFVRGVVSDALLHLEGHVHYGQAKGNYVNLGVFVSR